MMTHVNSLSSRFSESTSSKGWPKRFETVSRVEGSTSLDTSSRSSLLPTRTESRPTNCPANPSTSPETAPTANASLFVVSPVRPAVWPVTTSDWRSRSLNGGLELRLVSIASAGPDSLTVTS
jgi:hypothetical protein